MTTTRHGAAVLLMLHLSIAGCGGGGGDSNATDTGSSVDAGAPDIGDEPDMDGTTRPATGVVLVEGGFVTGGPTLSGGGNIRVLSQGFEVSGLECSGDVCATGGFVR